MTMMMMMMMMMMVVVVVGSDSKEHGSINYRLNLPLLIVVCFVMFSRVEDGSCVDQTVS